jgi:hypothetical protein
MRLYVDELNKKKDNCVLFKTDFDEGISQDEMRLFAKDAPNERFFSHKLCDWSKSLV